MSSMREKMEAMVRNAQDEICEAVSKLDGTEFREDNWERPGGGGGTSRVIQGGLGLRFQSWPGQCLGDDDGTKQPR